MLLLYWDRIIRLLIVLGSLTVVLGVARLVTRKRFHHKFFLKSELVLLGITAILAVFGRYGKIVDVSKANTKTYTKSELIQDLNQLKTVLFQQSPMYYTNQENLKESFKVVEQQLMENMTEEEFYRLVNPLVVAIQCGHTNLSISKALQENREINAKFFPVEVRVEEDKLIDVQTGDTIISINGNLARDIITTLLNNISRDGDNLAGAYYILNLCFSTKYYDFIEQPDQFNIVYQKSDGTIGSRVVSAVYDSKNNVDSWGVRMAQYEGQEYYTSSFTNDTATLRLRVFMEGEKSFSDFLKEFFAKVEETQCKKVIIDVRGNFGGDPRMAKELLSYLITEPLDYFRTDVSLMEKIAGYDKEVVPKSDHIPFETELWIDGACFSTCGHFAAMYQSLGLGVIKGEPTGGGSICTDGSKNIVLYQTGLRLHYATEFFEVNADCEKTNVVCPEEEILVQ